MDERLTILLIEDDQAIAELYRLRLMSDGYIVDIAEDGEAGLARARAELPDLIFLDLRLPNLSGLEVLEQLRSDETTAAVPVVILTNYDEPNLRSHGLRLGALEFLIKADTVPAELSASAHRWITSHELDESGLTEEELETDSA